MGFPRHKVFKEKNKEIKGVVERFHEDCKRFDFTADTSIKISFDGEKLQYSIINEEYEIGYVTPTDNKEDLIKLFSEICKGFGKVQIEMSVPTNFS